MFQRVTQFLTSPNTSLFVIGLMFCFPFTVAYHHLPIAAFYGEWLAALLGVIAMFTLLSKDFWQQFQVPEIALVFVGLAAILGMQYIMGMLHSAQYALLILSYLAWALMLVVLGSYLRKRLGWQKVATVLAWFMVLGGAINIVFVGMQFGLKSGLGFTFMPNFPSYGALAQRNNFADYIALSSISLMYLYAKEHIGFKSFLFGLILLIILLAFSGSRSTWLYLGGITALATLLQIVDIKQRINSAQVQRLFRVSLMLILLFIVIQFLLGHFLADTLIDLPNERIENAIGSSDSSLRVEFWHTSWYLFKQSPWLGIGAGQIRWQTFFLLDNPAANPAKMVFEHSHNVFMHLLAEMGVGGALLAIIGLGSWGWGFRWRELDLESWWLLALLAIIGTHSLLEYPLWYTYFLGVFAFLLGAGEQKITLFKLSLIQKKLGVAILSIVLIISAANLVTMRIAYTKLETWVNKAADKTILERDRKAFFSDYSWIHNNSLLGPYAEIMLINAVAVKAEQVDHYDWLSESAMHFMPMPNLVYQHALLLKLKGDDAGAAKLMKLAMIAYPNALNRNIALQPAQYQQQYLEMLSVIRSQSQKK